MPRMMAKLERLGCDKSVVGLVLPTGYTFNADGTCIYLTMAAIFVAQATNTPLGLGDQLVVLGVLLLTSKGSAGVAGAGFVTLAATLSSIHTVPVAGLVLLLGVDRFMNEARAVTNLIGNGIATIAIAKWEGAFDRSKAEAAYRDRGRRRPRTSSPRRKPAHARDAGPRLIALADSRPSSNTPQPVSHQGEHPCVSSTSARSPSRSRRRSATPTSTSRR